MAIFYILLQNRKICCIFPMDHIQIFKYSIPTKLTLIMAIISEDIKLMSYSEACVNESMYYLNN